MATARELLKRLVLGATEVLKARSNSVVSTSAQRSLAGAMTLLLASTGLRRA